MRIIQRFLLISLLLTIPFNYGCSRYAVMKRQEEKRRKELAKEQERRELEAQAAYEEAVQRHYDMQTKETRKEMKQNMKKSIAWKENKKPFFLIRWFTPKHKKKPPRTQG